MPWERSRPAAGLDAMDRTVVLDSQMLVDHLAQAERHLVQAQEHVRLQHDVIAKLQRNGHDTRQANTLLNTFIDMEAAHLADRDRLRRELAKTR